MNCNKAQALMLDHLYGELKPRKERALLRHLYECPKCSEELETHKATASTFAKLDMEAPPRGLSAKIVAMAAEDIERQKAHRTAISWNWKPALATVTAATLAIVVVVKYIPRTEMRQSAMDAPAVRSANMQAKQPVLPSQDERKKIAPTSEMMSERGAFSEYRKPAEEIPASGRYGGERDILGDDVTVNGLLESAPKGRAGGLAGGKISAGEPRDSKSLLHAAAPPAKQEPGRLVAKEAQSAIRYDLKDQSLMADAEGEATADFVKRRAIVAEPEAPAPARSQAPASAPVAMKKEKAVLGGTASLGDRKSDLDAGQEETENAYFNRREFNEAVMSYEKSISRKPEGRIAPEAMYKLGQTYHKMGQCEKAVSVYEAIPEEHPDFAGMADVYVALGECYLKMGRVDDALHSFEIVRDKFPAKREIALQKIDAALALQEAAKKANESGAESGE